jgi:hypothetical protein
MAITPPPPFDRLVDSRFSLYPAIVGIEHNEWTFSQATWSEALIRNTKTEQEIWISRQHVGDISKTDEPVLILGLSRELEYKGGMLVPFQPRVLKMPEPVFGSSPDPEGAEPPHVFGVRLESSDRRALKLIGIALGAFLVIYIIAVGATRIGDVQGKRVVFTATDTSYQELTPRDDRFAIVTKLGQPAWERSKNVGTIHYEALTYTSRRYTVLLMGADPKETYYIGTMDDNWKPIHSVAMKAGGNTESLLHAIQRF